MGKVTKPAPWPTGQFKPYEGKNKPLSPDDPRYPIFQELYLVRIPVLQMRSVEDIKEFGVPISGDERTDRMISDEVRQVMLPISKLVELFKQGCRIGVVNGPDTKRMYEAISVYLEIWKNRMINRLNTVNIPTEDLIDLDRFAHSVYERAKWHFTDEFISVHMSQIRASGVGPLLKAIRVKEKPVEEREVKGVRVIQPLRPNQKLQAPELDEELVEKDDFSERKSMADFFRPNVSTSGVTVRNAPVLSPSNAPRTTTTNQSIENLLGNNRGKQI